MSESKNPFPWHHWPQQSPINLARDESLYVKAPKSVLTFDYRDAPFMGRFKEGDGHRNFVLVEPYPGKYPPMLTLGGVRAELVKIHLHTRSEHSVEGKEFDGEIHLIHKIANPTGGSELIVVGVFFQQGAPVVMTDFFAMWSTNVGKRRSTTTLEEDVAIDPRKLLPKSSDLYRYEGSLTSEPYSETVSWLVLVETIGVGSDDFKKLEKNAHQPERPVQPINRRFVIRNFQ